MGELEGIRGAWGYPEGGMGAVSDAIAKSAEASGADIITENSVKKVIWQICSNWPEKVSHSAPLSARGGNCYLGDVEMERATS